MAAIAGASVFSFCLCDGVGQSFNGEIAADVISTCISEFLFTDWPTAESTGNCLREAGWLGRRLVERFPIPSDTPAMLKSALESKRQLGSETTLVAGRLVVEPGGQIKYVFTSLGDSRLLWREDDTPVRRLQTDTNQRWSTHRGIIGAPELHFQSGSASRELKLRCYTDGLSCLDSAALDFEREIPPSDIREISQQPDSDDIAWLEILVRHQPTFEG